MLHALIWIVVFLALIVFCILNRWIDGTIVGRFMLALDIFGCAVFLMDTDMTISSRCGLALLQNGAWYLRGLGKILNVIQKNHTSLAIQGDLARARKAIAQLEGVEPALKLGG